MFKRFSFLFFILIVVAGLAAWDDMGTENTSNDDSSIEKAEDINVKDLFGTKKEVKELPNVLRNNETIMYATSGFVDGNTWLITCTDKRILFLDKGMIYDLWFNASRSSD